MVYFFQADTLFCTEIAKSWPILTLLIRIYALFGTFTGLNDVMVSQNGQISDMHFINHGESILTKLENDFPLIFFTYHLSATDSDRHLEHNGSNDRKQARTFDIQS